MACFLVPMGEAIVTTSLQKVEENREKGEKGEKRGWKWSQRLSWLNRLLWGGVLLLALEHIWHGEVVPWPPFLTAMGNPADVPVMLHEMATIGTAMAIFVTVSWAIVVMIAELKAKAMPEVEAKAVSEAKVSGDG